MAELRMPSIDKLMGQRLRVCTPIGWNTESFRFDEREIWVLFHDEEQASTVIARSLPVSFFPLLHVGARFVDGKYQMLTRKNVWSFTVNPEQGRIFRVNDPITYTDKISRGQQTVQTVVDASNKAFVTFGAGFAVCGEMPFLVFRNKFDFLVISIIEVIRLYYTTLCSSYLTRFISEGSLTSDDELDKIINLSRSHIKNSELFIVLRKELVKRDRFIAASLYYSNGNRFREQAAEIIQSAQQPENQALFQNQQRYQVLRNSDLTQMQIGFPVIQWPFSRATKIEFEGRRVSQKRSDGQECTVYYVHQIVDSEFHQDYSELNFDMDGRNITNLDQAERGELPIGWQKSTRSSEKDPETIDTSEFSTPTAKLPKFDILIPETISAAFDKFPGKQISDRPQISRSGDDSEQDEGSKPDSVTPGTSTSDGQQGGLELLPEEEDTDEKDAKEKEKEEKEKRAIQRAESLKNLNDSLAAIQYLEENCKAKVSYFTDMPFFSILEHTKVLTSWRHLKSGLIRQAIFAEININGKYIYFLDASAADESLSSAVIAKNDWSALNYEEYIYFIDKAVEIRGRWGSTSAREDIPAIFRVKALSHSYTSPGRYALGIIRAVDPNAENFASILKTIPKDTAHSAPAPE